jgi:hypothetical protein
MTNPTKEFLSLREIGRRLNIPPSSVVYYKDRFGRFIPEAGGKGRRKKYPVEAITVFKEIRDMFDKNWSAEQIEETLGHGYESLYKPLHVDPQRRGEEPQPSPSAFMYELTGALEKISSLLQNQALFRAEIDSLRQELVQLKREKLAVEERYKQTVCLLETEVEKLRAERADIIEQVVERMNRGKGAPKTPSELFLSLPLVIKSGQNEYLGVAGKTKHFSLKEFLRIIKTNAAPDKPVTLSWRRSPASWTLTMSTRDLSSGQRREHIMEVAQTMTPNKNNVVQLTRLTIDGNPVPEPFLLVLFRKIKDGFDD